MSSANPYVIIDDGDDDEVFDWDAAAREIDVACKVAKPSTPLVGDTSNSRQMTLHKFLDKKEAPRPRLEEPKVCKNEQECFVGDEGVSCIEVDAEAVKTWIYPVNVPLRDYQFAITKSALFSNTLVALPTGLGKTLIAAVVMYNYFRWFPRGKIVFTAPSRPLVMQQIEACHNIVGIPQEWTIDMTGQVSPAKRACFWKTKRVFFVTPQVLEKDIHSGKCLVKYLVCLVIDEAHRAMGNYSYCEVVRELMAVPVQLRILALTATPGAKQQTVQQVIDNLQISKLEYRNENDPDVISYVHKRKIELIQVAMGQDAVEINKQLLDVIRPLVGRLSAIGVLKNRDYRTLSPCELLEMREKFRQAPPQDLSNIDVEGHFGVLISLYYIHKLLSSHGIRPAHEMLERKLKQGFFAKYMSKNEVLLTARMLMQQNLSHGAPSPKLSKMLEILREHFKANDPQSSRVIIFSNYRESVRDIMDAIANIGEPIRATQFIGQSSGKTMKGQSQKVQQAVLQKFRSGAYNVIVATSIGEEGLDIMEVDLVVAFDANVSPLRMIQRMGRTGRKHDGQVVVLACEGTELKGYLRKQAKSKAISKHMRNGGINSFTFHPSPRMIPHVFKPEVQFVELSIEKFVSREKKVKDDSIQIHASIGKLTVAENNILAKYFPATGENTWKPSLIAFPYFQTYPSKTHKVNHSCRAIMLIDLMQRLQGQASILGNSKTSILQDGLCIEDSNALDLNKIDEVRSGIQTDEDFVDLTAPDNIVGEQRSPSTSCIKKDDLPSSSFIDLDENKEETCEFEETVPDTPIAKTVLSNEGHSDGKCLILLRSRHLCCKTMHSNDITESQCSPRLTSLITSGVVPESPINERGDFLPGLLRSQLVIRDSKPPIQLQTEQITSCSRTNEKVLIDNATDVNNVSIDPADIETQTILFERKSCAFRRGHVFSSPTVEEGQNPFADITNHSFSEESPLCCGEVTESVKPARKFKRLRKDGDGRCHRKEKSLKDRVSTENLGKISLTPGSKQNKHGRGGRKSMHKVRVFIDDEAEVSSEADVSNDEDGEDDGSLDSFIDDRMNPTASTQSKASGIDMMAIYRRSLLSQLPVEGGTNISATFSPEYVSSMTKISENGDSSGSIPRHLQTPQIEPTNQSASKSMQSVEVNQITSEAVPSSCFSIETTTEMRSRKSKLTFHHFGFPSTNLEQEFALQSNEESTKVNASKDILCDDHIFDNMDLDELEAQAASLLKQKSDLSTQKQVTQTMPQSHLHNPHLSNPSFDLGI
ncbi:LOW QUALITY PROTEIN: DEAD-box ATP-dependent RNA helicase FANCM-like [Prosopis cineraria]|uniref:LOW QUALITY PROTEIN: DEAD-box ATP-dependent RNA helicase FANCM-like n=1 Tax=Prosopis cineraria TaxID=364024 RepID=UPI00240FA04D|nr:LOW QUALITY PROTEIN: DEAD-box ATP-dependent RNA helicase FANCM-like [Prosopis cineraria]